MDGKKDKNIEAIAKIISLTRDGKLEWRSIDPSEVSNQNVEEKISSVFVTQYKDKILRVYSRKYKGPSMDVTFSNLFLSTEAKSKEMRWYGEVVLELINNSGISIWTFPKEDILKDLLTVIKYKVSGADDLINSLLME